MRDACLISTALCGDLHLDCQRSLNLRAFCAGPWYAGTLAQLCCRCRPALTDRPDYSSERRSEIAERMRRPLLCKQAYATRWRVENDWGGSACSWQPRCTLRGQHCFAPSYVQPGDDISLHLHGVELAIASVVLCFVFQRRSRLMLDADTSRFAAFWSDGWAIASAKRCTRISACSCRSSAILRLILASS
jgi:hypothetical protein